MKRKVWLDLLIVAITAFLSTAALADCRLDPREVRFADDSAARMKSAIHARSRELDPPAESMLNFMISRFKRRV
jgi:hypothetical protein